MVIEISPASLDRFERYRFSSIPLRRYLRGECQMSPKGAIQHAENAFRVWLESGAERLEIPGCPVPLEMEDGISAEVSLPRPVLRDVRARREFSGVVLCGRLDGVSGHTAYRWKLSPKINLESCLESWQWRAYLAMLPELERVEYHMFRTHVDVRWGDRLLVKLEDHASVVCTRYSGVEAEVEAACLQYAQFMDDCVERGLLNRTIFPRFEWEPGIKFDELEVRP